MAGKRGAPLGNKNGSKNRPWSEAIQRALSQYQGGDIRKGQAMRRIAEKIVERALQGDRDAWKEIGERLDGKAVQAIQAEVDAEVKIRHESV